MERGGGAEKKEKQERRREEKGERISRKIESRE